MNAAKIKKLSKQCCDLQTFKDRCTWADSDFSVGDCVLDTDTSQLIDMGIRAIVQKQIESLKEKIKTEATK